MIIFLRALICVCSILCIFAGGNAHAFALAKEVTTLTLPNGMRWLLVARHQAPIFSGVVMVRVGGVDESDGKVGVAHMLEHMAFKGSRALGTLDWSKEEPILKEIARIGRELTQARQAPIPDTHAVERLEQRMKELKEQHSRYYVKNEVWELLSRSGARDLNAFTSKDVTAYHASMPINRLELWMAVFSQMISDPVFREFYTERDVIAEERRSGIDNNPDGMMMEAILDTAFQEGPYRWSTIGPIKDIQGYLQEDAQAFQQKYYVPERMVGVIVGDIDLAATQRFIKTYFGAFPVREPPPDVSAPANVGGGKRTITVDAQPSVAIAYHKPTLPDPTEYAFDVVTTLMCDGSTSRLYRRLVIEEKVAHRVSCSDGFPGSRLPNLFIVWVEPMNGTSPDRIVGMVRHELDALKTGIIKPEEIERVRKKVAASFLFALETNADLAMALARYETTFGSWRLLVEYPERVAQVTAADVQTLAQNYFTNDNQTVVIRKRGER